MAKTSAKPKPETGRPSPENRRPNPYRDPKALPRQAPAPSPDSPKSQGDDLLDVINPLRHVAKDLT